MRVHHAAFAVYSGRVAFGLDNVTKSAEGSSLVLTKRSRDPVTKRPGGGPLQGNNTIDVQAVDGVSYLQDLGQLGLPMSLKLDVEAFEFELMRDLLSSGVLCAHVRELFVEWHTGRFSWKDAGLPLPDSEMLTLYRWLLRYNQTADTRDGYLGKDVARPAGSSAHCKTLLFRWD